VFLDESGVNTNMARHYASELNGKRANDSIPLNKGRTTTILSSDRSDGSTVSIVFSGVVNREKFKEYIQKHLVPTLHPGDFGTMDNLPCHKVAGIVPIIEKAGASVMYLPPYSPDLNPIEQMWSRLKACLRMVKACTLDALLSAVPDALATVSVQDIIGWFQCAGYSCF
jgi:transposase